MGGGTTDPAEAVDAAIRHWLAAQRNAGPSEPAAPRGYQWKSLFLPEGTWLRMAYRGDHEYAIVEGDHIMHRGRSVSPNQFAGGHADSVRNAWRDISIRMPGEKNWKMAYIRRRDQQLVERQAPAVDQRPPTEAVTSVPGPSAVSIPQTGTSRNPDPGIGWTAPERRKFRFRLEDVAFD